MSEKHTPGPWSWLIHDVSMASLGVGDSPGMGTPLVLNVSPCRSCINSASPKEWEWGRCTTPSEADARLIAAAPELLEMLTLARNILITTGALFGDKSVESSPLIVDIDAALAKAEGRS